MGGLRLLNEQGCGLGSVRIHTRKGVGLAHGSPLKGGTRRGQTGPILVTPGWPVAGHANEIYSHCAVYNTGLPVHPALQVQPPPHLSPTTDSFGFFGFLAGHIVHERYYDELLRFFAHSVKDVHEAQDLTQQTVQRVLERRYAGGEVENVRALLYEVARNLLIDRHRQLQLRRHESDDVLLDHAAPAACEPEVVYAGQQRVQLLVSTIEALPPRCRQAFILHKIEGLPQAEVAHTMGVSLNMVERHIMLAVATCRKALNNAAPEREAQPVSPAPAAD